MNNLLPATQRMLTVHPLPAIAASSIGVDKVFCCDALDLLSSLPDASVDAVITDPPYNTTNLDFEQAIIWRLFWRECKRVLRTPNNPVVMFSQQPFTTDLINSNRAWFRNEIIWEKTLPLGFLDANRKPLRAHENILVFSEAGANYHPVMESIDIRRHSTKHGYKAEHYGKHVKTGWVDNGTRYPRSVVKFAQRKNAFHQTETLHPTEKPLTLMKWLVSLYSKAGDVIVDPFAGSGTTLKAAQETGRHYIGSELNPEYCDLMERRLAQPYTMPFPEMLGA